MVTSRYIRTDLSTLQPLIIIINNNNYYNYYNYYNKTTKQQNNNQLLSTRSNLAQFILSTFSRNNHILTCKMHSSTSYAILASLAVSGLAAPLAGRDVCGAAPTAADSQPVLAAPTGIQTAALCLAQCDANSSCESFLFGLVDNVIECKLFACAAANIPKQSSADLIAYGKACPSIPAVVPTASNPTGVNVNQASNPSNSQSGNNPSGNNPSGNTQSGNNQSSNGQPKKTRAASDICGQTPSGSGNPTPLQTIQSVDSLDTCLAKAKAQSGCER